MAFAQVAIGVPRRGQLTQWWQERKSIRESLAHLGQCGPDEIERIARDLSLTSGELRTLARHGVDSALLLYRHMADMGLKPDKVTRAEPKVMRDLQKLCTMCASKTRCAHDFARSADSSAWQAYCPNEDTLNALQAQVVKSSYHVRAISRPDVEHQRGPGHVAAWLGGLLLVWAWLIFDIDPQLADVHFPSPASLTAVLTDAPPAPALTCLDAGCLSTRQQVALRAVRSMQEQGWINTSIDRLQTLRQASLDIRAVHSSEASVCGKAGGTSYYGLMFHQGCNRDGVEAAKLSGYSTCQPMTGGGVCFLK